MNDKQTIMIIEAELDDLRAKLKVFEHWLAARPQASKSGLEAIATRTIITQYCQIMHRDERCLQ
jgi:hypothetical protein